MLLTPKTLEVWELIWDLEKFDGSILNLIIDDRSNISDDIIYYLVNKFISDRLVNPRIFDAIYRLCINTNNQICISKLFSWAQEFLFNTNYFNFVKALYFWSKGNFFYAKENTELAITNDSENLQYKAFRNTITSETIYLSTRDAQL